MDKLVVIYAANAFEHVACDPNDGSALACAIITPAAGVLLLLPSSVFAQQEETTLGEREDLASGIVSGVLDGSSDISVTN
jgi:hypothetical protein